MVVVLGDVVDTDDVVVVVVLVDTDDVVVVVVLVGVVVSPVISSFAGDIQQGALAIPSFTSSRYAVKTSRQADLIFCKQSVGLPLPCKSQYIYCFGRPSP